MDYPPLEELRKAIEWSIERGEDSYILNDYFYPYIWGYTLNVCTVQTGPVVIAQSHAQLRAFLAGEKLDPDDMPKYNIDWDIRNTESGSFLTYKKKGEEEGLPMMGSFDFNTPEEGAARWLEQIKNSVAKGLWMSWEEKKELDAKTNKIFQDFYDKHCADDMDCPLIPTCEVRWPTGIGLVGCRVKEFAEGPDGGYKVHLMTEKTLTTAKAITEEIAEILRGE